MLGRAIREQKNVAMVLAILIQHRCTDRKTNRISIGLSRLSIGAYLIDRRTDGQRDRQID